MTGALIILAVTILTGAILYLLHRFGPEGENATDDAATSTSPEQEEQCCGLHAVCEKIIDSAEGPVYYDDEELDRFAGRDPSGYTEEEIEEFRKILFTLIPEDVFPWGASLTLRAIALPTPLRDEWMMLCEDHSAATLKK